MKARLVFGVTVLALMSACGDDLESRQAAVEEQLPARELPVEQPQAQANRSPSAQSRTSAPAPAPTAQGFAEDDAQAEDDDELVFDAMPESLIDDAQGFSPEPMDDTSGFDPTPSIPQGFAPEPAGPETLND